MRTRFSPQVERVAPDALGRPLGHPIAGSSALLPTWLAAAMFLLGAITARAGPPPTENDAVPYQVFGRAPNDAARPPDTGEYLRLHAQALPTDGNEAALPPGFLWDGRPRLFLLGEVHGFSANDEVDLSLLRYLNRVAGIRIYISEISYAHAWYVNRYLGTGDPRLLDAIFGFLKARTVDAAREKRRFWERLRSWNQTLPSDRRVRVVGIDLERWPAISRAYLRRVASVPAEALGRAQAEKDLRERVAAGAEHRPEYDVARDRFQYANFQSLVSVGPGESVYGRMGFAHVLQRPWNGISWLSSYLEQPSSAWKGRVVGIWPLYRESHRLALDHGHYSTIEASDEVRLTDPFAKASSAPFTLFKLIEPDSPFRTLRLLPPGADSGATTDYFQYALLMQHAGPDTPVH